MGRDDTNIKMPSTYIQDTGGSFERHQEDDKAELSQKFSSLNIDLFKECRREGFKFNVPYLARTSYEYTRGKNGIYLVKRGRGRDTCEEAI